MTAVTVQAKPLLGETVWPVMEAAASEATNRRRRATSNSSFGHASSWVAVFRLTLDVVCLRAVPSSSRS